LNRKICLACNLGRRYKPDVVEELRAYVSNIKMLPDGQYPNYFSMVADICLNEYDIELKRCRLFSKPTIEEPPDECPYLLEHTLEEDTNE